MKELKQNTLSEATTESSFLTTINENAGETLVSLEREVTLEDGTTVTVAGITPSKMKAVLNNAVDGSEEAITYQTPGENYVIDGQVAIEGVCQAYNASIVAPDLVEIEITTPPTKTAYYTGELFDTTGMVVTGHYSNDTEKEITDYTVTPDTALTTEDTTITIAVGDITTTQEITITEDNMESIEITTPPTKTEYEAGEYFDPTGMVITATFLSGKTLVLTEDLNYSPALDKALTTDDTEVTISYFELNCTQAITVTEAQNEEEEENN